MLLEKDNASKKKKRKIIILEDNSELAQNGFAKLCLETWHDHSIYIKSAGWE